MPVVIRRKKKSLAEAVQDDMYWGPRYAAPRKVNITGFNFQCPHPGSHAGQVNSKPSKQAAAEAAATQNAPRHAHPVGRSSRSFGPVPDNVHTSRQDTSNVTPTNPMETPNSDESEDDPFSRSPTSSMGKSFSNHWGYDSSHMEGRPIYEFEDRLMLLVCFRDAIEYHRYQRVKTIWRFYADPVPDTIRIIFDGPTYRGILEEQLIYGDNPFTSIMTALKANNPQLSDYVPRDHIDTLESFYYTFVMMIIGYSSPNEPAQPLPEVLDWCRMPGKKCARRKEHFMISSGFGPASPYFGPIVQTLLNKLHLWFQNQYLRKVGMVGTQASEPIALIADNEPKDYAQVLSYFDEAIAAFSNRDSKESGDSGEDSDALAD
ncbi:hypothetical protein B0H34DRAFT_792056 [Crassisporium funariophilum]|nr:hypothetical protein B0H34DRAFT_792056 [Crassisporium funariophilum]